MACPNLFPPFRFLLLLSLCLFFSFAYADDADAHVDQAMQQLDEKPVANEPIKPHDEDADQIDDDMAEIEKLSKEMDAKPELDPKLDAAAVDDDVTNDDLKGELPDEKLLHDDVHDADDAISNHEISEEDKKEQAEVDQLLADVKRLEDENLASQSLSDDRKPLNRDSLMKNPNEPEQVPSRPDTDRQLLPDTRSELDMRKTGLDAPLGLAAGEDTASLKRLDEQAAQMPNRPLSQEALEKQPMAALAKVDPNAELLRYDPDAAEAMRLSETGLIGRGRRSELQDWAVENRMAYEKDRETIAMMKMREKQTAEELSTLEKEISGLKEKLGTAKEEVKEANERVRRDDAMHKKALDTVREEVEAEKEELIQTVEERKRAFDELYEEKRMLSGVLESEAKTLEELQEKIQHPDLGLWVKQRAMRASILMEAPENDAIKHYAGKYMAPPVTKMKHRLEMLEKNVEQSVDHVLPAKYGSVVAILLCMFLVGFPLFITMSSVFAFTRSVSLRQYVLIGNVFLSAFSFGLLLSGIVLRQDPLETLYEASENVFMMLQLVGSIAFPFFLVVVLLAAVKARDRKDVLVFGCEVIFYILVGLNYRRRVWKPAMLGENIDTSVMMYVVYFVDLLCMTGLTISSARSGDQLPMVFSDVGCKLEGESVSRIGSGIIDALSAGTASVGKKE